MLKTRLCYSENMKSTFSNTIEKWLRSESPKTIESLEQVVVEKSFAIVILLLMFLPALPIPTAAHLLELITMLLSFEMIVGRRTIWLPSSLRQKSLGEKTIKKALPFIVQRIRWFEHYSRRRFAAAMNSRRTAQLSGVILFLFAFFAFASLPFSGLDTLPALGAVILCLALLLEDVVLYAIGVVLGSAGVALVISTGFALVSAFKHIF
jgi:hypothetical protein